MNPQGTISCSECRFFADAVKVQGGFLRGVCKRNPVPVTDKKGSDWCGEGSDKGSMTTPGFNRRVG